MSNKVVKTQNCKKGSILCFIFLVFTLVSFIPVFAQKHGITIAGSTTIMPVSERWAKTFKDKTGINVNVHGGGSTGGINATKIGTCDIGASSRELSLGEKGDLKQIVIGKDALTIIVNKSNPINNISIDDVRGVFTGRIKNWDTFSGQKKLIQVVNRESGSGTRGLFEEVIMQVVLQDKTKKFVPMSLKSVVNNSNAEVKETIKLIPNSIGYVSVGYVDDSVKVLNIDSISPSYENIVNNSYPLVRNLYFLVKDDQDKKLKRFLNYVLSEEGQSLILKEGFLPVLSLNN